MRKCTPRFGGVFEDFRKGGLTDLRENATLCEIRMGIQFEF